MTGECYTTFLCHSLTKASVSLNRLSSSGRCAFISDPYVTCFCIGNEEEGGWARKLFFQTMFLGKKKNHLRLDSNLSVSSFSKHSPAAIC